MWKQKTAVFLVSQIFSLLGTSLVQYALLWYVTLETKSGLALTLYIIFGFLPTLILSPFAGVWADRYDRKMLIVLSDGLIAVVTLILAIVFMMGEKSMWLILLAAAIRAIGTAIQGPAVGAILPQFVPKKHLTRVNGISGSLQAATMLVAPVLSGVLISVWPMFAVFFIDMLTAAAAIALLMLFLKVKPHKKAAGKQKIAYFADMKLGFRYILKHRYLVSFFAFLGVFLFLITPAALLTPLQVARSFGGDVWRLTAIEVVFSVGMMAGGALIGFWGGFKNRMLTIFLSSLIMALCTVSLGLFGVFWLYLSIMGLFGLALSFFNTPAVVFIQEHVEESYMGRVFSVNTMLNTSIMPLGMLLFGPIAEIVRIEWILIVTGVLMFLQTALTMLDKKLIRAGVYRRPGR